MRVEPKPLSAYPWYLRPFFWNQKRKYGEVLQPALLWARSPLVFAAVALLYGAFERRRSPIDPVIRALITVRVSQINHCTFCTDINSNTLNKRGVSWDKIDALDHWRDSNAFDARERAVLAYAEAVVRTDTQPDDATVAAVREHLGADAFTELTGLIAFQNMSSSFNAALDVPPQGFCKPAWLQPGGGAPGGGTAEGGTTEGGAADGGTAEGGAGTPRPGPTPTAAERSQA